MASTFAAPALELPSKKEDDENKRIRKNTSIKEI